jgi:hypothetical protein
VGGTIVPKRTMAVLRHDHDHHPFDAVRQAFWGACGAIVLIYIFLAALTAVDPAEAEVVTGLVLLLAVLWLAHNWRRLWLDERKET